MKINKFVAIGLAMASMTMASGWTATPAVAASSEQTMAGTQINLNGQNISNPKHVVASDPWGGNETTWVPIYYLKQALKQIGFQSTWNGTDLTFTKYPAHWKFPVALGNQEANPVVAPKGQMQISLVDGGPPSMNFPKLIAKDPASGANTTYVPVYYVDTVLTHDFGMGAIWDGMTLSWSLTSQGYSPITTKSYLSTAEAANQVKDVLQANTYLAFESNSQSVNLGLGITAKEDAGLGHQGFQWHEGNWTIEVLYYTENTGAKQVAENMVSYLHTHMLPAPNNHGVVVVNSTDANTATFKPKTLIAWQEGNTVHELQQTGNPMEALQMVVTNNK